jgi:hypothetical protein
MKTESPFSNIPSQLDNIPDDASDILDGIVQHLAV